MLHCLRALFQCVLHAFALVVECRVRSPTSSLGVSCFNTLDLFWLVLECEKKVVGRTERRGGKRGACN